MNEVFIIDATKYAYTYINKYTHAYKYAGRIMSVF